MRTRSSSSRPRNRNKTLFIGTYIGFIASVVLVFLFQSDSRLANNVYINFAVMISCMTAGLAFGFILSSENKEKGDKDIIELRREKLSITKRNVQTGDVIVRKEVVHDLKNIVVPVAREDIVIENNQRDPSNGQYYTETVRIPYKEERVKIEKETVRLEDVSIFKRQLAENHRVDETLKKEKVTVSAAEDCHVLDE